MKLKIVIPLVVIALIAGAYFYPVTQQVSVTINTSMLNVYNQLNNESNWRKWDPDLINAEKITKQQWTNNKGFTITTPAQTIKVRFLDPFVFGIEKGKESYLVVLIPQKYDKTTNVIVNFNSSLLSRLLLDKDKWLVKSSIADLKKYVESPSSYYGADFKKIRIQDMDMMVYRTVVDPANRFTEIAKSVKKIKSQVPADALADGNKIYLEMSPSTNDHTMLVGVHIKKALPSTADLTCMHIPAGTAFIVDYKGRYDERQQTYVGMQTYLHDHVMKNTMQPIEVYIDDRLPLSDTGRVNTQIIFRVF